MVINRLNGEGEDPDLVGYTLRTTDLQGNPISQVSVGQDFELRAFVQDLRGFFATGVFAGYTDVTFNNPNAATIIFGETQRLQLTNRNHGGETQPDFTPGSTYRLTFNGQPTAPIQFGFSIDEATENLRNALEAIIPDGSLSVVHNPIDVDGTASDVRFRWDITFLGDLRRTNVPNLVLDPSNLTTVDGQPANSSVSEVFPADINNAGTFVSSFVPGPLYGNGRTAINESTAAQGIFSEVGSFSNRFSFTNQEKVANNLLWKIGFTASQAGTITFAADPADLAKQTATSPTGPSDTLVFTTKPSEIPTDRIDYGSPVTITIVQNILVVNDSATVAEDSTNNIINVLQNDQAIVGTLRLLSVNAPANGTATVDNRGTPTNFADDVVRYTPSANFSGADTFTYTVGNGLGDTATGTVNVTVTEVNDAPVAGPDGATTAEDTAVNIPLSTLTSNDSPGAGESAQSLTVTAVSSASSSGGTVTLDTANNRVVYTPAPNFFGTDTFTYTIRDNGTPALTAQGTVTVSVSPVNDAPIANPDSFTAVEDTPKVLSTQGVAGVVLGNDAPGPANESNQTLTIIDVTTTGSAGGTLTIDGNNVTYTPAANFFGTETFTYTIQDNGITGTAADPKQATGTVTVTVENRNDPPVAGPGNFIVDELSTDNAIDVLGQASPGPGETGQLRLVSVSDPPNGTAVIDNNGTPNDPSDDVIRYTPDANFFGNDTFTYIIADPEGLQVTGTVTVDVAPAVRPRATNDPVTMDEDGTREINVLGNDLANPGAQPTLESFTLPTNGTLTLNDKGTATKTDDTLTYTPNSNFFGTDTFTYVINDTSTVADKQPSTGTVSITVRAVNDAPVNTVPGGQTINEDSSLTFSSTSGNAISVADIDVGAGNVETRVTVANGRLTLGSTANVTVTGNNSASVLVRGTPANVNAALNGLTYQPNANATAADTLSVETSDLGNTGAPGALTDTDNVSITINALNDAPVNTVPGAQTAIKDFAFRFSSADGNAISVTDVDAGANNIQVTLTATNGTLTLGSTANVTVVGNGTSNAVITGNVGAINAALNGLTYTPNAGFTGPASLTMVSDDLGNTGSGGRLTDTDIVNIEVLDFIPSEISGHVFFDVDHDGLRDFRDRNGNGARDASTDPSQHDSFIEDGIGGVEVTLVGTDFRGAPVQRTQLTDHDGFYQFGAVAPGSYRVMQTNRNSTSNARHQPEYTLDGHDKSNGGVTATSNDEYTITIPIAGGVFQTVDPANPGSGLNFGERGVRPEFITLAETLASKTRIGLLAATDAPGNQYWFSFLDGWEQARSATLTLSNDLAHAMLTVRDGAGVEHTRRLSRGDNQFRLMGQDGAAAGQRGYIVRVLIDYNEFIGLAPGNNTVTSIPEGEAASQLAAAMQHSGQYAAAVDEVFSQV